MKIIKLILVVLLITLAGCKKEEPIQIGFVGTLSGSFSTVGRSELYAAQMAVEEINDAGGINGRVVELVVRDDEGDPETAVKMDNELLEMGIDIIIGHSISVVAIDVVENANEKGYLLLSPSIGTDSLTGIEDNFIRVVSTTYVEGSAMAKGILERNPENVLIVYNLDNYVLTQYHLDGVETEFEESGFTNFKAMGFESGNVSDINAIEEEIKSGSYDTLLITSSNIDASGFVNFVKVNDYDIDIHLGSWAATGILERIDTVDTSRIYSYFAFKEHTEDPEYVAFSEKFEETFGQPIDMVGVFSYDSVYILKEVIEEYNTTEYEVVRDGIIEISVFEGISGQYIINQYGDSFKEHYMMIYDEGDAILVE